MNRTNSKLQIVSFFKVYIYKHADYLLCFLSLLFTYFIRLHTADKTKDKSEYFYSCWNRSKKYGQHCPVGE